MRQYGNLQCEISGYQIVEAYDAGADHPVPVGYAVLTQSGVEIALYATLRDASTALAAAVAQ